MKIAIRLDAGNDTNGNPRRIFVVIDEKANVVDVIDEGYEGTQELKRRHGPLTARQTVDFETTPRQYRELLKQARETAKLGRHMGYRERRYG